MPTTEKLRNKLVDKLTELFQLDQPDLDFGFYRIMHAKAQQVKSFIDKDLLQIIEDAFGQIDEGRKAELAAAYENVVRDAREEYGASDPENTPKAIKAKAALDSLRDGSTAEADVYDHLYRFFERYYDDGDFISRRYYARENAGKAAPFAIPYNGEEVKLHWANADQYYIKTAEYFSNYSFDITQATEIRNMPDGEKVLNGIPEKSLKVHFRIVDASEGEHGNVKAAEDKKRFFILHEKQPIEFNGADELVINFEYNVPHGESLNKEDVSNQAIAKKVIEAVSQSDKAKEYLGALGLYTATDINRPLLAKYIIQYTARNTCDYFIHKDLSGFLKRELDFYIKNEVMHLDDIESADAPDVENYLAKIKVIRKIAAKLIDFLAQLEDFQKKLWLKKKFITETNYCITLDRVPKELYGEVVANDAQREEWVKLFAIDEIKGDARGLPRKEKPVNSVPLTIEFLKTNDKLVLDTAFFNDEFKAKLVAAIEDFDEQCDGLLIHSENFQALNFLQERYRGNVNCAHIDPPYNTATSGFLYKNTYEHSSWLSMMGDRIELASSLLNNVGEFICHIDENEYERLNIIFDRVDLNNSGTVIWDKKNPMLGRKGIATQHEYIIWRSKYDKSVVGRSESIVSIQDKVKELIEKHGEINQESREEYRKWLLKQQDLTGGEKAYKYIDDNGDIYRLVAMGAPEKRIDPKYHIPLKHPESGKDCPVPPNGWSRTPETLTALINEKLIVFGNDASTQPQKKVYLRDDAQKQITSVYSDGKSGKGYLDALGLEFPYCHPVSMYEHLLSVCSENSVFIDFFAGSGTNGHAILNLTRSTGKTNTSILVEMGNHFDTVLKRRITKVIYSSGWKDGKPTNRDTGISHCFKYIRLESYEDTLNNLVFDDNPDRNRAIVSNPSLKEDYMLRYLLDVETRGSQSLLNIDAFTDPTAYSLVVKKPGSDEQVMQNIDLIETFNYLLGLRLENMAAPQTFTASFTRKPDLGLPKDQHTKLVLDGKIQLADDGKWWFRKLEGWVPADPMNPNNGQKERVLIVWRKLTDNLEEDNLMLDEWFKKYRISTRDFEYDTIYANGSNNLPNLKKDGENWKVRLIEEEFHKKMWETEG